MDDDSGQECPLCAEARTTFSRVPNFHQHKKKQK